MGHTLESLARLQRFQPSLRWQGDGLAIRMLSSRSGLRVATGTVAGFDVRIGGRSPC